LTARIVDIETANRDLNKSLTELKVDYQVNVDNVKLENTAQGSKIIELDLKLRKAIVGRDEFERVNRVLSEENTVHRAEIDKFTKLLAENDSEIKKLKAKAMNPISRSRLRNQFIDSDDDMENTTMVTEPPDIGANGDGNPISDFHQGR
jgi:hypothetical protein